MRVRETVHEAVDEIILIERNLSFSLQKKPLHFYEHAAQFAQYPKINHVVCLVRHPY